MAGDKGHKTVRIDPDAEAWLQAITTNLETLTGFKASKAQVVSRALKFFGEATGVAAPPKVKRDPWGGKRIKGVSKGRIIPIPGIPEPPPLDLSKIEWGTPLIEDKPTEAEDATEPSPYGQEIEWDEQAT